MVSKYGITVKDDTCVIRLAGELDFANAEQVSDWMYSAIEKSTCKQYELDLTELSFLDSSGISVLVVAVRLASRKGAKLRATNPQAAVRRVIDTTGVDGLLGLA